MMDFLNISFEFDEKNNKKGFCVGRTKKDNSHEILKIGFDEQAEIIYKLLTIPSYKVDEPQTDERNGEKIENSEIIKKLKKIKTEIDKQGYYNTYDRKMVEQIIDKHISKLKGEAE